MTKLLLIAIFSVGIDASYYRLRHHERGENDQDIPSNDNITSRGDTRNDISEEEMALIEKLRDSYRRTEDKSKDILERILSGALNNSPREMQLHKDATNRAYKQETANSNAVLRGSVERGTIIKLSEAQKNILLNMHNDARKSVSPAANPPMDDLIWDEEISAKAAAYVKLCYSGHLPNRNSSMIAGGENCYTDRYGLKIDDFLKDGMDGFIKEKDYFEYPNTCKRNSWGVKKCGHYTQIVSANTKRVGCAVAQCHSWENKREWWNDNPYLVCQYSPMGDGNIYDYNGIRQAPYRI